VEEAGLVHSRDGRGARGRAAPIEIVHGEKINRNRSGMKIGVEGAAGVRG